jgi:hypothetical protein
MWLLVNGVVVGSQAGTGSLGTSTGQLQIGDFFQGLIDNVRIYNTALTQAQIQADMATPIVSGTMPPTAPTNLIAAAAGTSQINLSWTASTSTIGVRGYLVERENPGSSSFVQIGTTPGTTYSDTGLAASSTYSYRLRAMDTAGNLSSYSNVASATTAAQFGISPRTVSLSFWQTQQFTANATGVTWSVDGVVGGSSSSGTITSTGFYTAPNSTGSHTVTGTTTDGRSDSASVTVTDTVTNYAGTFTFHNDTMRTGENLNETVLTSANVNSSQFGKLFSYPLDGISFASPLYVARVNIPGMGSHNVVYVATEHDSVYAFDADAFSTTPLWQDSFINPAAGITPVPAADTGETGDIPNEIGITGTPVIDPTTNTLYVVAKTKEIVNGAGIYVQRLHALDLTTGAEKFGGPVVIQAIVAGTGSGSANGVLSFDPLIENQRPGLLLVNGVVYIGFASHGDNGDYHGWVLGYNASTLQQVMVYNDTANGYQGGIWMSGDGLATDSAGNIYFTTGNGFFDANSGGVDYGDSVVKLSPSGAVLDYFTPHDQAILAAGDIDLGSGGVLLLPDQNGPYPHELVTAGKNGTIYVISRDNMGQFNPNDDSQIIQSLVGIFPGGNASGNFSAPVYYNGYIYFAPVAGTVQGFQLTNGLLSTAATSQSPETYAFPGGMLAISANGATNGILWVVEVTGSSTAGVLHAYNPANLAIEYYNSNLAGLRDTMDLAAKFSIPLVANGKVFVAGVTQLTVYGLLGAGGGRAPSHSAASLTAQQVQSGLGAVATPVRTTGVDVFNLPSLMGPIANLLGWPSMTNSSSIGTNISSEVTIPGNQAVQVPILGSVQQGARMAEAQATGSRLMPAPAASAGGALASLDALFASPDMWSDGLTQR